jgi:pimeloyl-ACP methyl ester carboxylesterase
MNANYLDDSSLDLTPLEADPPETTLPDERARRQRKWATVATVAALALTASALYVHSQVRRVERRNPPHGRFMTVDGVVLHYVDRGDGDPLVMFHGNGTMALDFELAGLIDDAARDHRVIAFDRPGFGYSTRPHGRRWTPEAEAELFAHALRQLGVERATVLAHSWGTLVAVALGLRDPELVQRLILVSGYYYPTPRLDAVLLSPPAIPVVGALIRHTVAPLYARMIWPLMMRKIFGPQEEPESFRAFPKWLALRPEQLRAAAAESAGMIPAASRLHSRYRELTMPVTIIAGERDRVALPELHSERLHDELRGSTLTIVRDEGHMLQHRVPEELLRAVRSDQAPSEPIAASASG